MVDSVSKSACTLSWQPPKKDGGSPVTGYYVEVTSGYSSRFKRVNKQPITEQLLKYDLEQGETYEFQVCAENLAGVGPPSATSGKFTAKDPYDVPGKPGQPQYDDVMRDESVHLSWAAPDSDGGAPITGYVVEARKVGDVKWTQLSGEGDVPDTRYEARGLTDGEQYEFRAAAQNKAGTGPFSAPSKTCKFGEGLRHLCMLHFLHVIDMAK